MKLSIDWEIPKWRLEMDKAQTLRDMGDEALRILRSPGRLPTRSGSFASSIEARVEGDELIIGPTDERGRVIATVTWRKTGVLLFGFTGPEQVRIMNAGQRNFDRQAASGEAHLEDA